MKTSQPKFACFLTVRTGSSRLPQKTLLKIQGKRLIEHVIDRMKLIKGVDEIIMCTSIEPSDNILEQIAHEQGISVFRGSLHDKIARWLGAVDQFNIDYFVTVDAADDLFCDPELIDLAIHQMKDNPCDYLKIPDDIVCGGAAPCISAMALRKVFKIKNTDQTEFYPIYFTDTGLFNVREILVNDPIYHNKSIRLTLDYQEDYDLFKTIFSELGIKSNTLSLKKIIEFLENKPELKKINFFRQEDYLINQKNIIKLEIK